MTTWLDALVDSRGIRAIYGDDVPPLTAVDLHEVSLHRRGPSAVLRFDLARYPANPPQKWVAQRFNTVQLQLRLVDTLELAIEGWSNESVVDLSLERDGKSVTLATTAGRARIRLRALAADVSSISAYQKEDVSA